MAATDSLHPGQFPVYEVGDSEHHAPERGYHSTRYGPEHSVSPSSLGMPVGSVKGPLEPVGEERDLPLHSVSVEQSYVYEPHVRNLASVPGKAFHGVQDFDPVTAVSTPSGYVVREGTHRTTAALIRGDATIRARVSHRQVGS